MRLVVTFALGLGLVAAGSARSEDPPEGSIGVKVEIKDGKITVVEPIKNSPAEKAGIKPGDVIVKVDDHQVKENVEQDDLAAAVKEIVKHKPGEKVKLGIKRDGKDMTVEVMVGKRSEIFKDVDKD
jgi:carboxyl-terminal processing protease